MSTERKLIFTLPTSRYFCMQINVRGSLLSCQCSLRSDRLLMQCFWKTGTASKKLDSNAFLKGVETTLYCHPTPNFCVNINAITKQFSSL